MGVFYSGSWSRKGKIVIRNNFNTEMYNPIAAAWDSDSVQLLSWAFQEACVRMYMRTQSR